MPIFLIFSILFVIWVRYEAQKNSMLESKNTESFLEKERNSNFTRKADLTNLDYIAVPLTELPFTESFGEVTPSFSLPASIGVSVRSEILSCEKNVISLSKKKMLNLGGLSNTDIKMEYGVANLQLLIQYDDNFSKLSRTLAKWGKLLFDAGEVIAAEKVLSYAVSCKSDIVEVFTTLAKIYKLSGNEIGISNLVESCNCFDELRRENIINQITSI